jgi:biopolymer transport protein ExbD
MYLDAYPVTLEQLSSLLAQYKAGNPNLPVVIKGDAAAPYEKIVAVLAAVKKLDISQVGLVTKRAL